MQQAEIKVNHLNTDITLLQKKLSEEQQSHTHTKVEWQHTIEQWKQCETDKVSQIATLKEMYGKVSADWENYVEVLHHGLGQEVYGFVSTLEKQRTDFMVKLDEEKVVRIKIEKALVKQERELAEQTIFIRKR